MPELDSKTLDKEGFELVELEVVADAPEVGGDATAAICRALFDDPQATDDAIGPARGRSLEVVTLGNDRSIKYVQGSRDFIDLRRPILQRKR